jgi:hypothetical protein
MEIPNPMTEKDGRKERDLFSSNPPITPKMTIKMKKVVKPPNMRVCFLMCCSKEAWPYQ